MLGRDAVAALGAQRFDIVCTGIGALVWLPDVLAWARVVAGLRIEFVHEWDFEVFGRFEVLQRSDDGTYRLPAGQPRVPMLYSMGVSSGRLDSQ